MDEFTRFPKDDGIIVAPNYKTLNQGTLRRFFQFYPPGKTGEFKKNDMEFIPYHSEGGKIFIRSAENPEESLEAAVVRWVWGDEASLLKLIAWDVIQSRVGFLEGRVCFTTTPRGQNWLYYDFYKHWRAGNPDYFVSQFPSILNPKYPRREFDRVRETMSSSKFAMRYLGSFEKLEGQIWPNPRFKKGFRIPRDWKTWVGVDFGYTKGHETAFIFFAESPKTERVYAWNEYYRPKLLMSEHAEGFLKCCEDKQPTDVFFDSAAQQEAAELEAYLKSPEVRARYPWTKKLKFMNAFKSVELGIDAVEEGFNSRKLWIFEDRCRNFQDEIRVYARDEDGSVPKVYNNACDAGRYGYASLFAASSKHKKRKAAIITGI